ncbi:MAG: beta-phosphoglucomutase [Butyrivibrio sp.]|nr:beta-phosphoglucomutase [Butyrivibrio sp.]
MRAVIFDLDGVICFTDKLHYKAWKAVADELGIYFDEKINDRLRGVSRMDSLEIILENADRTFSEEEKKEIAEKKNNIYVSLLDTMSEKDLGNDVRGALDVLRQKGKLLAIGSSSKNTKKILEKIGLNGFFDAVSDGTNITRSKPDPEVFLKAAEMLEVDPSDAIVVEDAMSGIDAALAGGFKCVGIGEAATHPNVTYPLKDLSDLPKLV